MRSGRALAHTAVAMPPTVWTPIEDWLREHTPERLTLLGEPATREAVESLQGALGDMRLPREFVDAWSAHDGERIDQPETLVRGRQLLPIGAILSEWETMRESAKDNPYEVEAEAGIRPSYWEDGWVPFVLLGGASDYHCIDLSPTSDGTPGQIIAVYHDLTRRRVVAPDLVTYFAVVLERLRRGENAEPSAALTTALVHAFADRADRFREAGFGTLFQGDTEEQAARALSRLSLARARVIDGATLAHEVFLEANPPLFRETDSTVRRMADTFDERAKREGLDARATEGERGLSSTQTLALALVGKANSELRAKGSKLRWHGLDRIDAGHALDARRWILVTDAQATALTRAGLYRSYAQTLVRSLSTLPLAIAFWVALAFAVKRSSTAAGVLALVLWVLYVGARLCLKRTSEPRRPAR